MFLLLSSLPFLSIRTLLVLWCFKQLVVWKQTVGLITSCVPQELRQELHQLQADYSQLKQQHSALKARNKTLTGDSKELRSQITSLLKEKEAAREGEAVEVKGKEKRIDARLQREVERLRGENDSLSTQLSQRASEIISLKKALQEPHSQMSSRSDHHMPQSPSPVSPSPVASTSSHNSLSGSLSDTVCKGRNSLPPLPTSCARQLMGRRGRGTPAPHSTALMRQAVSAGHVPMR